MNNRIFAEKIINSELNTEQLFVWDEKMLREMLYHQTEDDSDEAITKLIERIKNGEKISFEESPRVSVFYLASDEEIQKALDNEKREMEDLDKEIELCPELANAFDHLFENPIF